MRRLLNDLHRLWAGLLTELFFEEGRVHSLGPAWTSQVPLAVENIMPKEKVISTISTERRTASSFCFRISMALRISWAGLIAPVYSTYGYKAILSCPNIRKPRLSHSFCFLDHFITIGVCFGINYSDFVGQNFGRTYGKSFAMEARITEVTSTIKRLEENLFVRISLSRKFEEVKKANVDVEDAEAQLAILG